jgi:hypothetical protein
VEVLVLVLVLENNFTPGHKMGLSAESKGEEGEVKVENADVAGRSLTPYNIRRIIDSI